jgi:hypothetical protein
MSPCSVVPMGSIRPSRISFPACNLACSMGAPILQILSSQFRAHDRKIFPFFFKKSLAWAAKMLDMARF